MRKPTTRVTDYITCQYQELDNGDYFIISDNYYNMPGQIDMSDLCIKLSTFRHQSNGNIIMVTYDPPVIKFCKEEILSRTYELPAVSRKLPLHEAKNLDTVKELDSEGNNSGFKFLKVMNVKFNSSLVLCLGLHYEDDITGCPILLDKNKIVQIVDILG